MCRSVRQTPQALTEIRTCPASGARIGQLRGPQRLPRALQDHRPHRRLRARRVPATRRARRLLRPPPELLLRFASSRLLRRAERSRPRRSSLRCSASRPGCRASVRSPSSFSSSSTLPSSLSAVSKISTGASSSPSPGSSSRKVTVTRYSSPSQLSGRPPPEAIGPPGSHRASGDPPPVTDLGSRVAGTEAPLWRRGPAAAGDFGRRDLSAKRRGLRRGYGLRAGSHGHSQSQARPPARCQASPPRSRPLLRRRASASPGATASPAATDAVDRRQGNASAATNRHLDAQGHRAEEHPSRPPRASGPRARPGRAAPRVQAARRPPAPETVPPMKTTKRSAKDRRSVNKSQLSRRAWCAGRARGRRRGRRRSAARARAGRRAGSRPCARCSPPSACRRGR